MKKIVFLTLIGVMLTGCQITTRDEEQHWGFNFKITCTNRFGQQNVRVFRVPDHKAYQHPIRLNDEEWMKTLDFVKSGCACVLEKTDE